LNFFHQDFNEDILKILKVESAVETKDSYGGTSLKRVEESIKSAKETLEEK
jgi:argininosuccinate lyase